INIRFDHKSLQLPKYNVQGLKAAQEHIFTQLKKIKMRQLAAILLYGFLFGCSTGKEKNHLFNSVDPKASKLDFINELKETDDFGILYYLYFYNGGGVAVGDINNDG